jgi:hypothetical protein
MRTGDITFKVKFVYIFSSSSGILVKTDVSEECITSIIRAKRISELGTILAVTSN